MRLLLTTDTVGGVWDYTATLARALERDGHALLLAIVGEPSESQLAQLPEEIAIECRSERLEWLLASAKELSETAEWLRRLAHGWKAELVHLNQMTYTALARFEAPTLIAVHSDAASWFGEVLHSPPPVEWGEYLDLVRAGLHEADLVVAPTRYQADLVRRHFGRAVDRVIHNGVEPSAEPLESRARPLLLSAGRAWDDAKGMAVFDRAVAILGSQAPPAHVLGDLEGPSGARFVPSTLTAHGRVPPHEVHRWMAETTIYVAPSLYEPFGLSPLEAAFRGCALVLSDIGSFRELWDGAATFFTKGSAPSLAASLDRLLSHPAGTSSLGDAARERALQRYTADRFAGEYMALYRDWRRPGDSRAAPEPSAGLGPIRRSPPQDTQCT